jgi:DNA-binding transcriptional LysR family regulator
MEDLNDIYFFASVAQHGGFSAAAIKKALRKRA